MDINEIRRFYAEEIEAVANIKSQAIVDAFAKVPRERFLGAGPWQIMSLDVVLGAGSYRVTKDDDPRHLYHNIIVAIDANRRLNNGQPSLIASWLDALDISEGEQVLHVGCGVGYYTAIIAEVVGPAGQVTAIEIDSDLALRARNNLADFDQVEVVHGDGGEYEASPVDVVVINAGATHPRSVWLDNLKPKGRLLLPLTFTATPDGSGKGAVLRIEREEQGYWARFLWPVMIYPCIGARDDELNQRLMEAVMRGGWQSVQSLRREAHEAGDSCWLHTAGFCLSTLPVTTNSNHN
jgi:protein-L-isoaspartate(D-aspartate) O-methyltransferase